AIVMLSNSRPSSAWAAVAWTLFIALPSCRDASRQGYDGLRPGRFVRGFDGLTARIYACKHNFNYIRKR
ncbi:MAG: hypothetical protein KGK06_06170, partial [Xanthomonadaceae bacterium]|nr:hypothetical protein [Xanthomonadaceae bacterium]